MTEDEKRMLEEEFKKAGSVPQLLEAMARSESKKFQQLKDQIESGSLHPTGDELYNYVLGWLDRKESLLVMDHLVLCGTCLREVIRIRALEEALTEHALERADRLPLISRVKDSVFSLFQNGFLNFPALEAAPRGDEATPIIPQPGEPMIFGIDPPADGHIVVFHYDEAGNFDLAFPVYPEDDNRVWAGKKFRLPEKVKGPAGKHTFKAFWTRTQLLDRDEFDLQDPAQRDEAQEDFFDALDDIDDADRGVIICEYDVAEQ